MKHYRFPVSGNPPVGAETRLTGRDARHIRTVLRLKPGDRVALFDGTGVQYEAAISAIVEQDVVVSILARERPQQESPVRIVVAQAHLKDSKMDRIVRQLTEIGVDGCFPFAAERSVARPNRQKLAARTERWRRIALEAAKQSRRLGPPVIGDPADLEGVLASSDGFDLRLVCWEASSVDSAWPEPSGAVERVFLLVGPEGGLTAEEVGRAKERGFVPVSLGPRILRAETAAVVAAALAQHRWGDLGGRPAPKSYDGPAAGCRSSQTDPG